MGRGSLFRFSQLASGNDLVTECSVLSLGAEPLSNLVGVALGTGSPWEVLALGGWAECLEQLPVPDGSTPGSFREELCTSHTATFVPQNEIT